MKRKLINIIKIITMTICAGVIIHDFYEIIFNFAAWTEIGFITLFIAIMVGGALYEDLIGG